MPKPNFFVVGAPKCGTTALYKYLRENPAIFMAKEKEPHFFAEDLPGLRRVTTIEDYLALYEDAEPKHLAIGDASVTYLFSSVAIQNIRKFDPNAKIIVMLRNPVDLAYSYHAQLLFVHHEDVTDFEEAWRLQEPRADGKHIPPYCWEPKTLQYRQISMLGEQMQRLFNIFPREQVLVILLDDMKQSTQSVYNHTLEFLNVPSDGREDFPVFNPNERYKIPWIAQLTWGNSPDRRSPIRNLNNLITSVGISDRAIWRVVNKINRMNKVTEPRIPLSPTFRQELVYTFEDDVQTLSKLIDRDLSSWLKS